MSQLYRADLALVHHLGFDFHAESCAPGIVALLELVRPKGGTVLEVGCGSGALTRHLVAAGHRVVATDASPAMVDLARGQVPDAEEVRLLALPDDPLPDADAVVSVGHVLNYLPDEAAIDRALGALAGAVRPGGLLAFNLLDLRWAEARAGVPAHARVEDGWAIVTRFEVPSPDRFVRHITTFLREPGEHGCWRRADERHDNVLVDTSRVPEVLARHGIDATVRPSFGDEKLPEGLVAIVGRPGLEPGPEA